MSGRKTDKDKDADKSGGKSGDNRSGARRRKKEQVMDTRHKTESEALDASVGQGSQADTQLVAQGDGGVCSQQGCEPLHRSQPQASQADLGIHNAHRANEAVQDAAREAEYSAEQDQRLDDKQRDERRRQEYEANRERERFLALVLADPAEAVREVAQRFLGLLSKDELRAQYRKTFKGGEVQPLKYMALRLAKAAVEATRAMIFSQANNNQNDGERA